MGASTSMEATRLPGNIIITDKRLGEGSFGVVYEGYYATDSSVRLAIKEFKHKKYFLEELKVAREIKNQFRSCPSYFMCMVDYFTIPSEDLYYIVYKKATSDLTTYMKHLGVRGRGYVVATRSNPSDEYYMSNLDDTSVYAVINTMINILEKLEKLKVGHRDIKMSNILVDNDVPIDVILGDMGLACSRKGSPVKIPKCDKSIPAGTFEMFPPYIRYLWGRDKYSSDTQPLWQDIYAAGATLYSFLSGMFPNLEKGSPLLDFPRDIKPTVGGVRYRIPRDVINRLVNTMVFAPSVELALRYKEIWRKYKNLDRIRRRQRGRRMEKESESDKKTPKKKAKSKEKKRARKGSY